MSLLDTIMGQLGGSNLSKVSEAIGGDPKATGNAIGAALPVLLGALQKNASSPEGAEALNRALEKDHNPSLLENLGAANLGNLFGSGGGRQEDGDGILQHLLGGKKQNVERNVAKSSGLDMGAAAKLLPLLAPVVMSALSKKKQESNLDANALGGLLDTERADIERRAPASKSLLGGLLDQDGDGDFDLGDITKGVLGKLF